MNEFIVWNCNICRSVNESFFNSIHREIPSCTNCRSTSREREVVDLVLSLAEAGSRKKIVIGLSDSRAVSSFLETHSAVHYQNTFLTADPQIDISQPGEYWFESCDVLINSDVIEHTVRPLRKSLVGSFQLLRSGGTLVLTAPWTLFGAHVELYPWLSEYYIDDQNQLIGLDRDGLQHEILNPIFHGGPGQTLVMREINLQFLLDELEDIGFSEITFHNLDEPGKGIRRHDNLGAITARKPRS